MRTIRWRALAVCLLTAAAVVAASPGYADLAAGGEIRLDSDPVCMEGQPDLAALPGGGFVAVWQQWEIGEMPRVFARIFGKDGTPLGPDFPVSGGATGSSPEVAANAAGNFLVVWRDGTDRVRSRAYTSTGLLLGVEQAVTESAATGHAVTATPIGFAVVTTHADSVRLWRFGVQGGPVDLNEYQEFLEPPTWLGPPPYTFDSPSVAAYGPTGVVAGWALHFEERKQRTLLFGIVSSTTVPMERLPAVAVPFDTNELTRSRPAVAANAAGRVLTVWDLGAGALQGQVYGELRQRLGPVFTLPTPGAWEITAPDAATTPEGDFLVAWQHFTTGETAEGWVARVDGILGVLDEAAGQPEGEPLRVWTTKLTYEGPSLAIDAGNAGGQALVAWETSRGDWAELPSCMSLGLFARSVAPASDVLRLRDGRFEVRVRWTDHAGNTGQGHATRLTGDSGSFWFFGPENVELIVKVLDGQAVNDSHWVFYGSLSDVAFTVEVTDTATGQTKTYENPAGQMASRADTGAFPGPGAPGAASIADTAGVAARSHLPGAGASPAGPCTAPDLPVARRPGLCLGDRFEVEVAWHANGGTGDADGVRLAEDSGYLWFFNPANIELVVKVLDGRGVNGHFWVFYGALTDVDYTVLVRDSWTGQLRTYHNPAGQLRSRADTAAF